MYIGVCNPDYYYCPYGTPGYGDKIWAHDETCVIDYDSCCADTCYDGTTKTGTLNDANGCDYESNVCHSYGNMLSDDIDFHSVQF